MALPRSDSSEALGLQYEWTNTRSLLAQVSESHSNVAPLVARINKLQAKLASVEDGNDYQGCGHVWNFELTLA